MSILYRRSERATPGVEQSQSKRQCSEMVELQNGAEERLEQGENPRVGAQASYAEGPVEFALDCGLTVRHQLTALTSEADRFCDVGNKSYN